MGTKLVDANVTFALDDPTFLAGLKARLDRAADHLNGGFDSDGFQEEFNISVNGSTHPAQIAFVVTGDEYTAAFISVGMGEDGFTYDCDGVTTTSQYIYVHERDGEVKDLVLPADSALEAHEVMAAFADR